MTREQWIKIWEAVKQIEENTNYLKAEPTKQNIRWEVQKIKTLIQSEIGQME